MAGQRERVERERLVAELGGGEPLPPWPEGEQVPDAEWLAQRHHHEALRLQHPSRGEVARSVYRQRVINATDRHMHAIVQDIAERTRIVRDSLDIDEVRRQSDEINRLSEELDHQYDQIQALEELHYFELERDFKRERERGEYVEGPFFFHEHYRVPDEIEPNGPDIGRRSQRELVAEMIAQYEEWDAMRRETLELDEHTDEERRLPANWRDFVPPARAAIPQTPIYYGLLPSAVGSETIVTVGATPEEDTEEPVEDWFWRGVHHSNEAYAQDWHERRAALDAATPHPDARVNRHAVLQRLADARMDRTTLTDAEAHALIRDLEVYNNQLRENAEAREQARVNMDFERMNLQNVDRRRRRR